MDSITNSTLFHPVTMNSLQGDLARYYERTSEYVGEQFQELMTHSVEDPKSKATAQTETKEAKPRLRPKGLGNMIDMFI